MIIQTQRARAREKKGKETHAMFIHTARVDARKKKKEEKETTFIHAAAAEVVKRLVLTTSASAGGTEEDCFVRNKKH